MKRKTALRSLVLTTLLVVCLFWSTATAQAYYTVTVLYRLYNPTIRDHFYTTDYEERTNAIKYSGYIPEGDLGFVLSKYSTKSGFDPLYRLWNPRDGDHLYTVDWLEVYYARYYLGWIYEGVECKVSISPSRSSLPFTVPVWRLYNPTIRDHFYTERLGEVYDAVQSRGYAVEGLTPWIPYFYVSDGWGLW